VKISFDFVSNSSVVPSWYAGAWIDYVELTAQGNHDPVLSNPTVSPIIGTTLTNFTYYATYQDSDGDSPSPIEVNIDGSGARTRTR